MFNQCVVSYSPRQPKLGGNQQPPRNMTIQTKPPPHLMDINLPHFGIYGHHARKPNTNQAEQWLQYHKFIENSNRQFSDLSTQELKKVNAFAQHERHVERRQLRDLVEAKLSSKIQAYIEALEKRRDKLRDMLAEEEEEYVRETIDKAQRADESKFANMKKRSEALKTAKEAERLELVKQKRIQQYSLRCVELRPFLSRKMTEESKICQLQQMRENEARRQSEAEINRMFDNLLKKQDEAFMEREVQEAIIKYNRCKKDMDVLTMQIRAKKHRDELNRELERANFEESQRMNALHQQQDQEALQRKLMKSKQDAEELRHQVAIQKQFTDQRKKEENALDNAFAKLAELSLKREQDKIVNTKGRLHDEMETYKHHLEHLKMYRKQEEVELNEIISGYQRTAQLKQEEAVCKYKAGRKKLLDEVMKSRAEQVQRNKEKAQKELEYQKVENEMRKDIFETNKKLHDEAERLKMLCVKQYRSDLNSQIEYNYSVKKREMDEAERSLQRGLEEERKLEALVNELIAGYGGTEIEHPFRRKMVEYDCKCQNQEDSTMKK